MKQRKKIYINKLLRGEITRVTLFGMLFILVIMAYYKANFSLSKEINNSIVAVFEDGLNNLEIQPCELEIIENEVGEKYAILPEYIDGKRVSFYTEKVKTKQIDIEINESDKADEVIENEQIDIEQPEEIIETDEKFNEIVELKKFTGEYRITEENKFSEELILVAYFDCKETENVMLYNKKLEFETEKNLIKVNGYMPEDTSLNVETVDITEAETAINNKAEREIKLSYAYDIKLNSNGISYEPYELGEKVEVRIEPKENKEEIVNIWHLTENDEIELIKQESKYNQVAFLTNSFSIYGVEVLEELSEELIENEITLMEEPEIIQQPPVMLLSAVPGVTDSIFVVNDATSDLNYWKGKNYTDNVSGTYSGKYENFANVIINYYGYKNNETNPNMIGWVSTTERYNVFEYHKTCPIENGKISIELIDNPFMDKPTGYGFGGWTSTDGTITVDSKTKTQTISVSASANSSITIDVYTNWVSATVVYVNQETGYDDINTGLTPDSPFGSWGAAFNYINSHSADRNDRERNIIVLTGDIDSSFNYTTPITRGIKEGDLTIGTTFTSGGSYLLMNGNSDGSRALVMEAGGTTIVNKQIYSDTQITDYMKWTITSSGTAYTIRNVGTGRYLTISSNNLATSTSSTTWTISNRRIRQGTNGRYIRYNNGWTTTNTSGSGLQFYFGTYTAYDEPINIQKKGDIANNSYYTSTTSSAVTITSLYNHTDYRTNAVMDLTSNSYQDWTIYKDFQIDFVDVNASGYTSNSSGTTITASYPVMYRKWVQC